MNALPASQSSPAPDVDIVVPVHDEQAVLDRSILRLHAFLSERFPFSWRIVIADNASGDATPLIARRLARELAGVRSCGWIARDVGRPARGLGSE